MDLRVLLSPLDEMVICLLTKDPFERLRLLRPVYVLFQCKLVFESMGSNVPIDLYDLLADRSPIPERGISQQARRTSSNSSRSYFVPQKVPLFISQTEIPCLKLTYVLVYWPCQSVHPHYARSHQ